MRSILALSPTPTHPQDAGNRARVFRLLSRLQEEGHRITFVHVGFEQGDREAMAVRWDESYHVPAPYRVGRFLREGLNAGLSILPGKPAVPFGVDDWYPRTLTPWLRDHLSRRSYDAVLVSYVFLSKAFECVRPGTLRILDTHDVFGGRHRAFQERGEKARWFFTTEREEDRALGRADVVLAIQRNEARRFRERVPEVEVLTVGYGMEPAPVDPSRESVSPSILCVGSGNRANVHGLRAFLGDVFPALRRAFPELVMRVAGGVGPRLDTVPEGCEVMGRVPDLRPLYEEAWVVVNPMSFGTGLKIKSLEALAHGKALVTTPVGADGIEEAAPGALRVAEDAEGMRNELERLIGDREERAALGRSAVDFMRAYTDSAERPLLVRLAAHT